MSHDPVAVAAGLAPRIRELRTETEANRQIPEEIVESLVESGLFRLAVPEEQGGLELDPLTTLEVYRELARAEGSVAWVVWNSSLPALFGRFLSDDVREEILGDPGGRYASSTRPTGRAVRSNGEYRISGRWSLVSGCMHADWIALMCLVEEDGEVETLESGAPHMRMAYLPADSCEIVDTWRVGGLRGTGSHDIVVEGVEVSAARTFSPMDPSRLDRPLGRMPIACSMSAGHAAICLGIAEVALESVLELGRSKVSVDAAPQLPDRSSNQFLVAETSTMLAALHSQVRAAIGTLWAAAEAGEQRSMEDLAATWSAAVTLGRACRSAVTSMYEVAGTPSLYVDSALERCHRDVHAAMQHIVSQRYWVEEAGRVQFGMEPTHPLFAL